MRSIGAPTTGVGPMVIGAPSSSSVRTMTRCAPAATLNALSRSGSAAASSASAAAAKASSVAGAPRSASSAARRPPRLVRDAAERDPAVPHDAVAHVERGGHRDERERERRAVAHLAVARAARRARSGGSSTAVIELAGLAARCRAAGSSPGRRCSSGMRDRARAVAALDVDVASSAASATPMSDGCVATQASECPRIAWLRCRPRAPGSRARLALVARLRDVGEVGAARALQQVAADRRHVAQLPDAPASSACASTG